MKFALAQALAAAVSKKPADIRNHTIYTEFT
jgi:hypothetical protein